MVSWGDSIVLSSPVDDTLDTNSLWCLLARPKTINDMHGNNDAAQLVDEWFSSHLKTASTSSVLFVEGPCGSGKSLAVNLAAQSHGFRTIMAFASESRSMARFDAHVRQATAFQNFGVVVLDEFESFAEDHAGLDNVTRFINTFSARPASSPRVLLVCISNEASDAFSRIIDRSTFVQFDPLSISDTHGVLKHAHRECPTTVAPMDLYLFASQVTGDARQAINQFQIAF
ncbi:unnamed protein product, partial [Phaeothamnion confervicola]